MQKRLVCARQQKDFALKVWSFCVSSMPILQFVPKLINDETKTVLQKSKTIRLRYRKTLRFFFHFLPYYCCVLTNFDTSSHQQENIAQKYHSLYQCKPYFPPPKLTFCGMNKFQVEAGLDLFFRKKSLKHNELKRFSF